MPQSPPRAKYEWGPRSADLEKEKTNDGVNFDLTGNLLRDTNTYRGIVIKYSQPNEARRPRKRWRLYPFKEGQNIPFYSVHRQSAYLFGRNRLVADIPIDHPSCSSQHAVLQYRSVQFDRADGSHGRRILPYIIDLNSSNGTFLNDEKIEPQRFYELREKDVIRFAFSTREYVLLHEDSKAEDSDEHKEE
ncbi:hypothetical protein ACOME3_010506 [Neoechinorhynchus agilis]